MGKFKIPEDSDKYQWTHHVVAKMRYYGISEGVIKRIVREPHRKEEGIAPGTIAVMQPRRIGQRLGGKPRKWREELWVMYRDLKPRKDYNGPRGKKRIISAWRYPGMSPVDAEIPLPEDIRRELENMTD